MTRKTKITAKDDEYTLPPIWYGPDLPHGTVFAQAGEINWGMEKFLVQPLRDAAGSTKVKLGIVDTGVDPSHQILRDNYQGSKDFTNSSHGADDGHGHGTHCSGTVCGTEPKIGVASGFPFYHGKGLGDQGSGGSGLYSAIEWCLSEGCLIVSNSWGGGDLSASVDALFKKIAEHPSKPWLIFAGGNSGPNTPDADNPGRSRHVINVAAVDSSLNPASFSSAGDKLDTSGPGVNIWSARPRLKGGGYQQMSGTSMATPFVAGLLGLFRAALVANNLPIPDTYELRKLLASRSMDIHTPGDDRRTGPGAVWAGLLALVAKPDPPPVR